jgi:tetratricopeptide (TPR) repeat protein
MAEAEPGSAGGYVAFISYSHKDAAMGRWLHRKLEGYRLPKRLAGTQGENGEVPERLTPIFRDRDELPAAGDLSERVRAALAVSRSLIVVCSPNSAASPWVAKEIATFRELHPGRPIFTAIIKGEPDQCFSPALVEGGVEPLAADLRKRGDGRRLGMLKLVAALAGIGLDSLVQRDAARQIRRVTYFGATAVAAMLVMALLTMLAISARAEADRQRAEAEGLIEFMLTDLRTKLKGVGSIEVQNAVNRRAISYYDSQGAPEGLPDDSVERRARILHAIGEDYEKWGDLDAAIDRFREAHAATAATLSRHPNDPAAIFAHGQSEYWIGRVHELRGEWPQAALRFNLYARAAKKLIGIDPRNPDYMLEMAWGASNRGVVQRDGTGDQAAAQRSFEAAIQWFEKAIRARSRTGDLRDLANAYGDLADTYHVRKLWKQALHARLKAYEIIEPLHRREPNNVELAFRLAIAERAIAHESARTGDRALGTTYMLQAYRRTERLTARDTRNAEWLLFRARIECDLLNPKLGLDGPSEEQLIRGLISAAATLEAQRNPRVTEVKRCLDRKEVPAIH